MQHLKSGEKLAKLIFSREERLYRYPLPCRLVDEVSILSNIFRFYLLGMLISFRFGRTLYDFKAW